MMKNSKWHNKLKMMMIITVLVSMLSSGLSACTPKSSSLNTVTGSIHSTTSSLVDTDGDGIPDYLEETFGTNLFTADTDGNEVNDKVGQRQANEYTPLHSTVDKA